jgi:probable O-glycosylation ligase (exosortase A-associated)
MWEKVVKTMLMVLVTLYVLNTKRHVMMLVTIVTLSVAFYGFKGGLFTITGGGVDKVYGPGGSFIEENNSLALAVIMTIPLLRFLQTQVTNVWLKRGLLLSMVGCGFSALGSQSRGALIGIAAMLVLFWLKSRNKSVTLVLLAALVPFAIAFMPDSWEKRMRTIETYEEDASAMGRINTWRMAINVAADRPLTGGGFEMYNPSTFARYAPNPNDIHAAHSIWFQVLGEHGWVGLGLFLLLGILAYRNASWIIRKTKDLKEWRWASEMARMIQVSLVGYGVGGAFLSLAYYDVPYYLIAALVLTRKLVEKELGGNAAPFFQPRQVTAAPSGSSRPVAAPAGTPVEGRRGAAVKAGGVQPVAEKIGGGQPLMSMDEIKRGFGRG